MERLFVAFRGESCRQFVFEHPLMLAAWAAKKGQRDQNLRVLVFDDRREVAYFQTHSADMLPMLAEVVRSLDDPVDQAAANAFAVECHRNASVH